MKYNRTDKTSPPTNVKTETPSSSMFSPQDKQEQGAEAKLGDDERFTDALAPTDLGEFEDSSFSSPSKPGRSWETFCTTEKGVTMIETQIDRILLSTISDHLIGLLVDRAASFKI